MKKRSYMAPAIKTRKIEYTLMAAISAKEAERYDVPAFPGKKGGDVLAKPNNDNAWSSEEDE